MKGLLLLLSLITLTSCSPNSPTSCIKKGDEIVVMFLDKSTYSIIGRVVEITHEGVVLHTDDRFQNDWFIRWEAVQRVSLMSEFRERELKK
jgi:hypothetical protein